MYERRKEVPVPVNIICGPFTPIVPILEIRKSIQQPELTSWPASNTKRASMAGETIPAEIKAGVHASTQKCLDDELYGKCEIKIEQNWPSEVEQT